MKRRTMVLLALVVFLCVAGFPKKAIAEDKDPARKDCERKLSRAIDQIRIVEHLITLDVRLVMVPREQAAFQLDGKTFPYPRLMGWYPFYGNHLPDPRFYTSKIQELLEQSPWEPLVFKEHGAWDAAAKSFPGGVCTCPTSPEGWRREIQDLGILLGYWWLSRQDTPYLQEFDKRLSVYLSEEWLKSTKEMMEDAVKQFPDPRVFPAVPSIKVYPEESCINDACTAIEFNVFCYVMMHFGTRETHAEVARFLDDTMINPHPPPNLVLTFRMDIDPRRGQKKIFDDLDEQARRYAPQIASRLYERAVQSRGGMPPPRRLPVPQAQPSPREGFL